MNFLVGDIGGTNTRLLFVKMNRNICDEIYEKSYLSQQFSSLSEVIKKFLLEYNISDSIDAACFAIAGPVENGIVSVTNLPWIIKEDELMDELDTSDVKLINDFLAVAIGISELKENDVIVIQEGQNPMNSDAAIIGAGSGLGAAHLVWIDNHYHPYSSEAGHTGFAPENTLQSELLIWMQQQHSHVSLEMLLSGKGLVTIYEFLHKSKGVNESLQVKENMKSKDPAQVISEYALADKDDLCQQTLACFIDIYGAAAGNTALYYYPIGEIYIAGGIAAKIKDKLISQDFIKAFVNKGLLSENMKNISIKLVVQDNVGLYGALAKLKSIYL